MSADESTHQKPHLAYEQSTFVKFSILGRGVICKTLRVYGKEIYVLLQRL
jgi:hypothetical protein